MGERMDHNRSLTTSERESIDLKERIQGWGADLDPNVRPGVPRDKAPMIGVDMLYTSIEPQIPKVKIHQSTEHQRMTPVFGTAAPPQFVSGFIRDYAYTLSEGRISHWLLLLAADRINVVEDFFKDLSRGHVPNLWKEMGLSTELKYNRKSFQKKAAVVGIGAIALGALMIMRGSQKREYLNSAR